MLKEGNYFCFANDVFANVSSKYSCLELSLFTILKFGEISLLLQLVVGNAETHNGSQILKYAIV